MNELYPEVNKIGLNIELKIPEQYKDEFGIDISQRLWDILKKHNLHLKSNAAHELPIIIQTFDISALKFFKEKGIEAG